MARARSGGSAPEVSLFPFLSILACLIGALVLMITTMVLNQTADTGGLTEDEFQRATDYRKLMDSRQEELDKKKELKLLIAGVDKTKKQEDEVARELLRLKESLAMSKSGAKGIKELEDRLQQERDLLAEEKERLEKEQIPEHNEEIKRLKEEIAKLQIKPEEPSPVIVPPTGSGLPQGVKIYFVDAGSGAIKVLDKSGKSILRVPAAAIPTDKAYEAFLKGVQAHGDKARLIFLMRDDGIGPYNDGAGLASNNYGISVGKLPVPGKGEIDLRLFAKYLGPPINIPKPPAGGGGDGDKPKNP